MKIVKVEWYDTQSSRGYTFKEAKEVAPAILTVYGELITEDENYLTIACYYDNEAEILERTSNDLQSFFVKVVKKSIIELKELVFVVEK